MATLSRGDSVRNRLGCFVGRRLHTPEPAKHRAHVAQREARHRRFGPFQPLQRGALVRFGDVVDIWRTVGRIEPLTGVGQQRLDVFPDPLGPIGHHPQPPVVFRKHAGLLDLSERFATLLLRLHVMPTQEMHDPITITQIQAPALRVTPLPPPPRPLGPCTPLPRLGRAGTLGTRWHRGPVEPQYHHRTPPPARCHRGNTPRDRVARGRHLQHRQALSHMVGPRVHPFTAQPQTGQVVQEPVGLVLGHFRHPLGRRLLHVAWGAPRRQAQDLVQWVPTTVAGATIGGCTVITPPQSGGLDGCEQP